MPTIEFAEGVQFTLDGKGQVTAVVVEPGLWRRIVDALEDTEDRALVDALRKRLTDGPEASNALQWQDIADEWQ